MPGEVTSKLAGGQYFAIVQHPMEDNKFNIEVSGDYVRLNNDTSLFKITGPGSLQGSDAADALIAAISGQEAHDDTFTNDTYTIVPSRSRLPYPQARELPLLPRGPVILPGRKSGY